MRSSASATPSRGGRSAGPSRRRSARRIGRRTIPPPGSCARSRSGPCDASPAANRPSRDACGWRRARGLYLAEYAAFLAEDRGPRRAEDAARKAIEEDPSSADGWAALGLVQIRRNRFAEADGSLGRALAIDPENVRARKYAVLLLRLRRRDDAADALVRSVRGRPDAAAFAAAQDAAAEEREVRRLTLAAEGAPEAVLRKRLKEGPRPSGRSPLVWEALLLALWMILRIVWRGIPRALDLETLAWVGIFIAAAAALHVWKRWGS